MSNITFHIKRICLHKDDDYKCSMLTKFIRNIYDKRARVAVGAGEFDLPSECDPTSNMASNTAALHSENIAKS